MPKLQAGDTAPDFSLLNDQGQAVSLRDYRGRQPVVLIFYPGDDTPGCTKQLCAVRDDAVSYAKAKVAVFGINHADATSHTAFIQKYGLTAQLLVDEGKRVAKKYDALKKFFRATIINRTVVGISTEGKVVFYKRGIPSTKEILSAFG
jgi:peroxiredoxin Q/BCP